MSNRGTDSDVSVAIEWLVSLVLGLILLIVLLQ